MRNTRPFDQPMLRHCNLIAYRPGHAERRELSTGRATPLAR